MIKLTEGLVHSAKQLAAAVLIVDQVHDCCDILASHGGREALDNVKGRLESAVLVHLGFFNYNFLTHFSRANFSEL